VALSASAPSVVDAIESKLKEEEWLVSAWSPVHLNRVLNQWYFKEGVTEVSALKVWQDSCQYLYLPRLLNSDVFVQAVTAGCATRDGFGYAAGKDGDRWLGFSFGYSALVTMDADTVLISQAAAIEYQQKLDAEQRERAVPPVGPGGGGNLVVPPPSPSDHRDVDTDTGATRTAAALPQRFFGLVEVDATTATMDFSTIVNEVIQHFAVQAGTDVTITVEVEARSSQGFDAAFQRTISENCAVLKFRKPSFE
jgi:hypothetical protein